MSEKFVCCLCGKHCEGFGNNPAPLRTKGRCCDFCDQAVILVRIGQALNGGKHENKKD